MSQTSQNGCPALQGVRVKLEPPFKVKYAPGRKPTLEGVMKSGLLSSMQEVGQLQDIIICPSANLVGEEGHTAEAILPGDEIAADGNQRLFCGGVLGISLWAIRFAVPLTEADLIEVQLTTDLKVHLTPDQFADKVARYLQLKKVTQEFAAKRFGKSPGYVSKLLAPLRRLCPDLHHLYENPAFCREGIRVIATMPTEGLQKQLAERALTLVAENKTVKRDWLERIKKQMLGQAKGQKETYKSVNCGGITLKVPVRLTWEQRREELKKLLDAVNEAIKRNWPPDSPPPGYAA